MKILYTGGGTMGSVSPLIAVHQKLQPKKSLWLGTRTGPERKIVEDAGIKFKPIISGKLRRYFDLRNITDLIKIKLAWWQSLVIILKFKPDVILSAGSFVSVPVIWAGRLLGKKILIHQQDVRPGLANKLMAPFATRITVALDKSLNDYNQKKTVLVGNPIRKNQNSINKTQALKEFNFSDDLPVLLVVGGGTGSQKINELIWESAPELTKFCQIIHITGKDKNVPTARRGVLAEAQNYKSFEFLTDKMISALQTADIVIARSGMSTLTELAYLKKPSIIIPMPGTHQQNNAKYFSDHNSIIYLDQKDLDSQKLISQVKNLLNNKDQMKQLGENMHKIFIDYSGNKIVNEIEKMVK